ncbi:hypothetical protein ACH5RR_036124 [Cinchona calisaya]|uniref:Peptidase A1 domain-containing protein n=1 Tax=Cinchona calisaya TaxID=153742 RepID=A0ABD2Y674_9GENT
MAVLIFLSFSLIISSVLSRTLPQSSKTTVLDITSSLRKTRNVFSLNNSQPINALENQESSFSSLSSSSSLSFELHSRVGFRQVADIVDYKSLTLARLERNSARVKSLQTRVHMAVHRTQLDADKVLRGPVTSGTSQGVGEYFTRVGIGSPPRRVFLALDTGSDVTWLQCAPCAHCYQQVDPIFQPASSSSFSPLSCESQQCRSLDVSQCGDGTCQYEVDYGDRSSSTEGDLVTETITFGGSAPVNNMAIGCGHDNRGLFAGAAGLIGLGGGPLSFPSQIKATSFSYCFVDPDSEASSTLDFNAATPTDAVTVPLLRNPKIDTFRYVDLTGISVAGELLSIPPSSFKLKDNGDGGVVIDSGTTLTLLQTEAYNVYVMRFLRGRKTCRQLTAYLGLTRVMIRLQGRVWRCQRCRFISPMGKNWCYRLRVICSR